jgi:hypothetical protein
MLSVTWHSVAIRWAPRRYRAVLGIEHQYAAATGALPHSKR